MITTLIKDYEFETIIGLLEFERIRSQKVRINVEFQSSDFIDYVEVINFIESIYDEHKFKTVENSLEVCSKSLKDKFGSLTLLKMEILKIEILDNALVGARFESKY